MYYAVRGHRSLSCRGAPHSTRNARSREFLRVDPHWLKSPSPIRFVYICRLCIYLNTMCLNFLPKVLWGSPGVPDPRDSDPSAPLLNSFQIAVKSCDTYYYVKKQHTTWVWMCSSNAVVLRWRWFGDCPLTSRAGGGDCLYYNTILYYNVLYYTIL